MAIETLTWTGVDGEAATIANTGYDGIDTAGGSLVFDSSWMPRNRPTLLATGTTTQGYLLGRHDFPATDTIAYDQPLQVLAVPTGTEQALFFFGAGESRQVSVVATSTGILRIRDGAGSAIWSSPAGTLAVGSRFVLSVYVKRHPTAGEMQVTLFAENGTTVVTTSGLLTGLNTGSSSITRVKSSQAKSFSNSVEPASYRFGRPRWDRAASGLLPSATAWRPFRMWVGGAYVPVDVRRWTGSAYESVTSA